MRDAVTARLWRGVADGSRRLHRSGSARNAQAVFGPRRGVDDDEWNRRTSARHEEYRAAVAPLAEPVTVVCVSRRPRLLNRVIDNVRRQGDAVSSVVFVANDPGFDQTDIGERFDAAGLASVDVMVPPAGTSLGAALNLALDSSETRFVAKFDDDDHYGPGFLADALRAHRYAGAGVVGKHTYYAEVASVGRWYLRFPANEFRYSSTLAGGTLVIDRDRTAGIRFEDVSIGEDRAFLTACHRRRISTFAADRFNFVQHRGDDNTWTIPDDRFLAGCAEVDRSAPEHAIDR